MSAKAGVKRPRTSYDEQQPTVHVTYKHLTRASKQKLESLLQKWSEWEAENTSLAQVSLNGEGYLTLKNVICSEYNSDYYHLSIFDQLTFC
jgi:hypothetical protein